MKMDPTINSASRPLIAAENVRKVYGEGDYTVEAISSASFSVDVGEFVSILGPSGCGKSTLLSMVAGLDQPTAGQVSIGGVPVEKPRREVGLVFQDAVLLPWKSAMENTLFPIRMMKLPVADYRNRAKELLDSVGLRDFHDKRPHELSGGMKQRVAICRSLIHDPDVLLMDEPFSALDTITRDQMNVALMEIWERYRKTALFVTHSIREAVYLSDRVLVMGRRPSTVIWDQEVPFARPRDLSIGETAEFNRICGVLRRKIDEAYGETPVAAAANG
jgi:NitT/TauT family transport system ATP-binding protein